MLTNCKINALFSLYISILFAGAGEVGLSGYRRTAEALSREDFVWSFRPNQTSALSANFYFLLFFFNFTAFH